MPVQYYLCYNDKFVYGDISFWRRKAELEQEYRELMASRPETGLEKAEIVDSLAVNMGMEGSDFVGIKVDEEEVVPGDPFGDLLVEVAGKR